MDSKLYNYPIASILNQIGCRKGFRDMYFSPFRDEKEPSLHVDHNKNLWFDHGMGVGGTNVQLVMMVNHIESLLEHYESTNELEMTKKINSINSFKGLKTSSVVNKDGLLEPDLSSRYSTADFPYGLDILLSFASVLKIDAPNMKKVSKWYHDITGIDEKFELTDHNINSISDIKDLYLG